MIQNEDGDSIEGKSSSSSRREITEAIGVGVKSRTNMKPTKSMANIRNKQLTAGLTTGASKNGHQGSSSKTAESPSRYKLYDTPQSPNVTAASKSPKERAFSKPEYLVSDCWRTSSGETPLKFVELFKEGNLEDADEADLPISKRRLDLSEDEKSPPYTKEFHLLTEVQKARILTVVEDTIKKLAYEDHYQGSEEPRDKAGVTLSYQASLERFFCKKFLLPWVIIKVVEMVLCHIIQLTFLSQDSYFERKNEFLPVVVTYYLTLFIVVISLVVHISCFSYSGLQNPCYFMGVISFSILTLTTSLGIFIMLTSMEYYRSFAEILVLVFIGVLLFSLFGELCLCYIEVKKIWNRVGQNDQYYIS